jgi:Spy/CpxP family protein refolding chaperone
MQHKAQQQESQLRSRDSFDESFVRSVAQQNAANMADALVEKERVRAEIFAVLTPEQRQKFDRIASELRVEIAARVANLGSQL